MSDVIHGGLTVAVMITAVNMKTGIECGIIS